MLFFTEVVLEQKNRNDWGEIAKEFRKQTCIVLTNVSKWRDVDTDPTMNETPQHQPTRSIKEDPLPLPAEYSDHDHSGELIIDEDSDDNVSNDNHEDHEED